MTDPLLNIPVQLDGISEAQGGMAQFAQESTAHFDEVSDAVQRLMDNQEKYLQQLRTQVQAESTEVWKVRQKEIDETKQKLKELQQEAANTGEAVKASGGGVLDWVSKIPATMTSRIPGATLMQGGLIGLLLYGFSELGRIEAEAGRLSQIFEASSNQAAGGVGGLARTFKDLEDRSLVAREQMRGVVEIFARIGVSAKELIPHIADVNTNIAGAAMAFDAFLERPMGTSAQEMVQLMDRYKLSGRELIDTYGGIVNAARESGIGTERFMAAVFDSSRALKTYGVDIKNVSGLLLQMMKDAQASGMGVEASLTGAVGLAQSISRLPTAWQAVIGQDVARGAGREVSPLVGLMEFQTGFMRTGEGNQQQLVQILSAMASRLEAAIPRGVTGREREATLLQAFQNQFNMSPESASMMVGMMDNLLGGKLEGIGGTLKLSRQEQQQLSSALLDEGQKQSAWNRAVRQILGGIGDVAMAVLDILTTGIGSFMSFVAYVVGWVEKDPQMRAAAVLQMEQNTIRISNDFKQIVDGLVKSFKGVGEVGTFGAFDPVRGAFNLFAEHMERQVQTRVAPGPLEEIQIRSRRQIYEQNRALVQPPAGYLTGEGPYGPDPASFQGIPVAPGGQFVEGTGNVEGENLVIKIPLTAIRDGTNALPPTVTEL